MSSHHIIEATARNQTGTGASRSCRRNGIVPGIVYGEKKDPVTIAVDHKMIKKEIQSGSSPGRLARLLLGRQWPDAALLPDHRHQSSRRSSQRW